MICTSELRVGSSLSMISPKPHRYKLHRQLTCISNKKTLNALRLVDNFYHHTTRIRVLHTYLRLQQLVANNTSVTVEQEFAMSSSRLPTNEA